MCSRSNCVLVFPFPSSYSHASPFFARVHCWHAGLSPSHLFEEHQRYPHRRQRISNTIFLFLCGIYKDQQYGQHTPAQSMTHLHRRHALPLCKVLWPPLSSGALFAIMNMDTNYTRQKREACGRSETIYCAKPRREMAADRRQSTRKVKSKVPRLEERHGGPMHRYAEEEEKRNRAEISDCSRIGEAVL